MNPGKMLVVLGLLLLGLGLVFQVAGRIPWVGKLPGDFRYETERFTLYFPLATCVVLSLILTLLWNILRRWGA